MSAPEKIKETISQIYSKFDLTPEDFKEEFLSVLEAKPGKTISCLTCKALKVGATTALKIFEKDDEEIFTVVCDHIHGMFNIPATNCVSLVMNMAPYVIDNIIKLISYREDFVCGLLLKKCASPGISWFDTDGYINRILTDPPTPISYPPATGKNGTYKILQVNDIHLDPLY